MSELFCVCRVLLDDYVTVAINMFYRMSYFFLGNLGFMLWRHG